MGRKWIMVELGEHCHTHIIPRLQKVIDGQDMGGITEAVEWKGGGGFRYYRIAPSLLEQDKWGNWVISKGFTEIKRSAYTVTNKDDVLDFRHAPADKSKMPGYIFGGFQRCLCDVQKFQSNPERQLAIILDRESLKWVRPAKGQFQIFYRQGSEHSEYVPDFVAETESVIYMLEPKARNEMEDPEVLAKKEAALRWCKLASDHAKTYGGKPWVYALIPHDVIAENMTLKGLVERFKSPD